MTHIDTTPPVALVTGGSAGLGRALVRTLSAGGWHVVTDARHGDRLADAVAGLPQVTTVVGDVRDADHRRDLAGVLAARGRLDLLVHNASELGAMRPLADTPPESFAEVLQANVVAPLALTRLLLPTLRDTGGTVVGISSDAAAEHYQTWGTYAASKAALDHAIQTLAGETGLRGYAVDPGDMRTAMHQQAFPGEDISDRPRPEEVVARVLTLVTGDRPSGRYRATELAATEVDPRWETLAAQDLAGAKR